MFGPGEPPQFQAGAEAAGMTPATPFSPGEPIQPYDGYSRVPRSKDFIPGYNIAARPRSHERVSFHTLRGIVEAYDVAQMCIWHRIDSIRSLDWSLVAAEGHEGDVTDAIKVGMKALEKPDRKTPFETWLGEWLYDVLAYDAGCLARLRNRGGRAIGLKVVDGTTIAPMLDDWGDTPEPPAVSYVQYVRGLPYNWLTTDDLIYTPFRKKPSSPYGTAPIETILLNANTDIRFQWHFLQRFTEGNLPAAFASAPETWTPDEIEQWQEYWDAAMLGDQAAKHQIRWMPGGHGIIWSSEKEFTDTFSLFLMRKTAAAYHTVPADLGFTENVNRSSGESQADVQHRVGDLPLVKKVQRILSAFLQADMGLPVRFAFDLGEEQADRVQQAQADKIYVDMGAIGASEIRERRYGLSEPNGQVVPRYVFTERAGPIPLASLFAVAGEIDPATAAPAPGAILPHAVFSGAEGVAPSPPIKTVPLAEQEFGPSAMPPAPPPQPQAQFVDTAKNEGAPAAGGPTVGITSDTGVYGSPLLDDEDEDEDEEPDAELVKAELAAFKAFRKGRRRAGVWRDFEFRTIDADTARELNEAGRLAVAKAGGGGPKGGDAADWPGWSLEHAAANHWAPKLAGALGAVLTVTAAQQLVADYIREQDDGSTQDRSALLAAAEAWLAARLQDRLTAALPDVLEGMAVDGYLIGAASADATVSHTSPDLGGWRPGQTDTARDRLEQLGLAGGLAAYLATARGRAGSVAGGAIKNAARALVDGMGDKGGIAALGAALLGALTDPGKAAQAALNAILAAAGVAAIAAYGLRQVEMGSWETGSAAKVCPLCTGNAAAGPVPIGRPYPSGATSAPAHPNCRCAIVPARA
jgi:hypothetical protein